ncbi:MAG: type I DNA topoisomerase [Actinomycetota bacterium]|nr:type I DNA topoisomerase [Actinomycetota bacterium]
MAKNLVVVESPAKAKTIEKYMGKDYQVLASMGHVRDLPKSSFAVDVNGGVKLSYEPIGKASAKKAVAAIRAAAKQADTVWLAPDPDREGEAIAWHVAELVRLKPENTRRVAFNEITKKAVTNAFASPRTLDMNLVDAQQARRAVDRIVGYKLSPLLWRTVGPNLSAGRVQSAALHLVVQRERAIRAFNPIEYWDLTATLVTDQAAALEAIHPVGEKEKYSLGDESAAAGVVARTRPGPWSVVRVKKSERTRKPLAPFKTSTLQQAASNKLGWPTWKTMKLAQGLYEAGHITYMRTDSTNLSADARSEISALVGEKFGAGYHQPREFTAKTKGAQEAHEAIRPAVVAKVAADLPRALSDEQRTLYEIIWQRTVACQMADAIYDATTVDIESNGVPFRATGQVVKFDGYMRVYLERGDDDPDEVVRTLPDVNEGDRLELKSLDSAQHFTQPPPRYTEATLVREMERVGIGRPSTYSSTVKTLNDREYVRSESRRLFPTARGEVVCELLEAHFSEVVDVDFTARMEEDLDHIAEGVKKMVPVVREFFESFEARLDEQKDKMTRPERPTDQECPECGRPVVKKFGKHGLWFLSCTGWPDDCKWSQQLDEEGNPLADPEGTGEPCPDCGAELVVRSGRYGPFVGCSRYPDCKHIKKEPPKETGESCPDCGSPLVEKRGRFGPFTGCSNYPECKHIKKNPKKKTTAKSGSKTSRRRAAKPAPAKG